MPTLTQQDAATVGHRLLGDFCAALLNADAADRHALLEHARRRDHDDWWAPCDTGTVAVTWAGGRLTASMIVTTGATWPVADLQDFRTGGHQGWLTVIQDLAAAHTPAVAA